MRTRRVRGVRTLGGISLAISGLLSMSSYPVGAQNEPVAPGVEAEAPAKDGTGPDLAGRGSLPFADTADDPGPRAAAVDPSVREKNFAATSASLATATQTTILVQLAVDWNPVDPGASLDAREKAAESIANAIAESGGTVTQSFELVPAVRAVVNPEGLAAIKASGAARLVEPERFVSKTLNESVPLIGGTQAHNAGFTGAGQAVAVLDDGMQTNHPFLGGRVISEACYTTDASCPNNADAQTGTGAANTPVCGGDGDHGTHVSGIAMGNDGVAPDAQLIAIDVFDECSGAATSSLVSGLERVRTLSQSMTVASANLSLGDSTSWASSCDDESPVMADAVMMLRSVGIATTVASGNEYFKDGVSFPACLSEAVAVGATSDTADTPDEYSNSGPKLELLAPGSWIQSSVRGSAYDTYSGTSMAAPHVAGAFAVLREWMPNASVGGLLRLLQQTGAPKTDTNGITRSRINLWSAVQASGLPAPANDDFANARAFTDLGGAVAGDNSGADLQPGEPNHVNNASNSVWYKYNAPRDGRLVVATATELDTVLAAYRGSSVGALTHVTSNDDYAGVSSRVVLNVTGGTTYWFAVDGYGAQTGDFKITWRLFPRNDYFPNAYAMSGWSGGATSFNMGASTEPGEMVAGGGRTVWWRWTAPTTGRFLVNTNGSSFDTVLSAFSGSSLTDLTRLAVNDDYSGTASRVLFDVTAGTTYYFSVDGWADYTGNIGLNWRLFPKNDYFPSAVAMTGSSGSGTSWNFNGSMESGEPNHGSNGSHSVWWKYRVPFTGRLTVNTNGSRLDTVLAAYTGSAVNALTQRAANNDYGSSTASRVSFNVTAGQTIYIAVDGVGSTQNYIAVNWSLVR